MTTAPKTFLFTGSTGCTAFESAFMSADELISTGLTAKKVVATSKAFSTGSLAFVSAYQDVITRNITGILSVTTPHGYLMTTWPVISVDHLCAFLSAIQPASFFTVVAT